MIDYTVVYRVVLLLVTVVYLFMVGETTLDRRIGMMIVIRHPRRLGNYFGSKFGKTSPFTLSIDMFLSAFGDDAMRQNYQWRRGWGVLLPGIRYGSWMPSMPRTRRPANTRGRSS